MQRLADLLHQYHDTRRSVPPAAANTQDLNRRKTWGKLSLISFINLEWVLADKARKLEPYLVAFPLDCNDVPRLNTDCRSARRLFRPSRWHIELLECESARESSFVRMASNSDSSSKSAPRLSHSSQQNPFRPSPVAIWPSRLWYQHVTSWIWQGRLTSLRRRIRSFLPSHGYNHLPPDRPSLHRLAQDLEKDK